jgi:hypothetical protein
MLPDRLTSQSLLLRCQQATAYEHNKDTQLENCTISQMFYN